MTCADRPIEQPPDAIGSLIRGARWTRDRIGQSGTSVHRLERVGGRDCYLKVGRHGVVHEVADEAARLTWLDGRLAAPRVLAFAATAEAAWLLGDAVPGRSAFSTIEAAAPGERPAIVAGIAAHLRQLHALPAAECPFDCRLDRRLAEAHRRLEAGEVDEGDFGDRHRGWSAGAVWQKMTGLLPVTEERVVTHGDYSLDNIFMDGGEVTGCIDVGRLGVADPYQDLAILAECLSDFPGSLADTLLRAYGISSPDAKRLELFTCLDEFF